MRIRLPLLVLALGTAALAVPPVAGIAGAAAGTPTTSGTVTLTLGSDGTSVLGRIGQLVAVTLSGDHLRWSGATVVQSTPVLVRVSGRTTATGSSRTVFRIIGYGAVEVDATGTSRCVPSSGCPPFVLLWHASVVVPVVDPPGPTGG